MQWVFAATLTICGASIFTSCSSDEDDNPVVPTDEVEAQLQKMTLREKVGQLFYVRPECLDTTIHFNLVSTVDASADDITKIRLQAVNATMLGVNEKYPVGGITYTDRGQHDFDSFPLRSVPRKSKQEYN